MVNPLVSIIIPAYNARSTIERALQSIIEQDYISKEILVIDGDSTDGTIECINQFKTQIKVLISEKDSGVYQAINKGLEQAGGEWIYILGADDFLAGKDVLSRCLQIIPEDCELILGDVINIGSSHALVPDVHHNSFSSAIYWKNTIHQQGVFYRQSIFKKFRFNESLKILGDYDLHLKLWSAGTKTFSCAVVIASCSADGLSKQFNRHLYREELEIKRNRLSPWLFALNIPWVWMKYLAKKLG
jgi:putative colanic acid biosynthesis glycosyltransferase